MVHAFQYDTFSQGRAGAGFATIAAINPPLWFMEGMAEYLSLVTGFQFLLILVMAFYLAALATNFSRTGAYVRGT